MKLSILLMTILFSFSSYSQENKSSLSAPQNIINDFDTLFFTIGYKNGSSKINHNETSESSGFTSLNNRSSMTNNLMELGFTNEFFASSRISISASANYGYETGSDKAILKESNLTYSEKLSGNHFSAGASVNVNFEAYNIKIQPFVGATISKGKSRHLLSYAPMLNASNPTSIQYKNDIDQTDINLGVRFVDPKVKLMSFLSLNYRNNSKSTSSVSAANNNGKIDLTRSSVVDSRPLTLSIGFGFFF